MQALLGLCVLIDPHLLPPDSGFPQPRVASPQPFPPRQMHPHPSAVGYDAHSVGQHQGVCMCVVICVSVRFDLAVLDVYYVPVST